MTAVRLLTPADADAYASLRAEMLLDSPWAFLASPGDDPFGQADQIRAAVTQPGMAIFGIFDGARLLAVAGLKRAERFKRRHIAQIWGVYVTPIARRKGHARAMLTSAIAMARTWHGVTQVQLSASEKSADARRLYESLGFIPWGTEPDAMHIGNESFKEIYLALPLQNDRTP